MHGPLNVKFFIDVC